MNEMERNSNNMYAAQNKGGEASDILKRMKEEYRREMEEALTVPEKKTSDFWEEMGVIIGSVLLGLCGFATINYLGGKALDNNYSFDVSYNKDGDVNFSMRPSELE